MTVRVVCIWETDEIVLVNKPDRKEDEKGTVYVLGDHLDEDHRNRYGVSCNGSISLSLPQARALLSELRTAIGQYDEIDRGLNSWDWEIALKEEIVHAKISWADRPCHICYIWIDCSQVRVLVSEPAHASGKTGPGRRRKGPKPQDPVT